jgi:hypothetical protein
MVAGMATFIVRVLAVGDGEIRGTVEEPGGEPRPFTSAAQLAELLRSWEGKGAGSTSSSPIRAT